MSSDGEHFAFDVNAQQFPNQRDRNSPPTLDEVQESPKRPPNLFLPRQGSVDYGRYEQILKKTKKHNTVSDLENIDHVRNDVKECLNIEKEDRSDWRRVASLMGVKTTVIEKIKKDYKDDPTEKLFQEISHKKLTELLQVLYRMDRHDVLNIFFDEICTETTHSDESQRIPSDERRDKYKSSKFPSQESTPQTTPVSGSSCTSASGFHTPTTPKSPLKDTGTPDSADRSDSGVGSTRMEPIERRPKTGSFAKQNTDEDLARSFKSALSYFHSKVSTEFWRKIPPKPESTRKEWKEVEKALKNDFPKESMHSQVMRFICYILKIEPYEERHNKFVHDCDFANLVAWFGPVQSGKDGLFWKISELIKRSVTYKEHTGPHSFFAGYMSKERADKVIGAAEKVGTFLVRFSSTFAEEGSFVVVLKTDNGPEHVLLKGNPSTGKITYDNKEYEDLVTLWTKGLCKGGVSSDRRTSCTTTCPNLPLNAMFKPYSAGPRPPQSLGRGRGRGRGQEQ